MKIRVTDVVDEERKTLKSAVANLVMDNELLRERIRQTSSLIAAQATPPTNVRFGMDST